MAPSGKLKATKPSKVVKHQKKKRHSTVTTKRHRFQPFSERIAKLKIDPIRRRRGAEEREELEEDTATYFGRSLVEWTDSSLSATFTAFARDMAPYSDSLPVVLHNEDKIMDILMAYIEQADTLAMESLLSLLSHFAHDLDARFEKHFERAVSTITAVAAKHQDPAVVEWTFTCLAWLFKYLSRLLAPDLRPLYNLMRPYLGRETQKPFIIRFAAESLSFLVRKAAATYERNSEPLDVIVQHMINDCVESQDDRSSDLHRQGVMTLLTEAIKGVQNGIHSSGLAVLQSLLNVCYNAKDAGKMIATEIATGTLTSIIHHTTPETFAPVLNAVLDSIKISQDKDNDNLIWASNLMFTMVSVRKGTRIVDWKEVFAIITELINAAGQASEVQLATGSPLLSTLAVALQYASVDAILPSLSILEVVRQGKWMGYLLGFCDLCSRLDKQRFRDFVLPQLRKFIAQEWRSYELEIYRRLPELLHHGSPCKLEVQMDMEQSLVRRIDQSIASAGSQTTSGVAEANQLLHALPYLKLHQERQHDLTQVLERCVQSSLNNNEGSKVMDDFALGICLQHVLEMTQDTSTLSFNTAKLFDASSRMISRPQYWTNVLRLLSSDGGSRLVMRGSHLEPLEDSLIRALGMASHETRQGSLEILIRLYELRGEPVPDALQAANAVESTPISLESSRAISMNVRRLASAYTIAKDDSLIRRAIPTYCFGILHLQLAQAWDDAIEALSEIVKTPAGEAVVVSLAQTWLEGVPETSDFHEPSPPLTVESQGFQVVSDFECSNLAKVSAISNQVFEEPHNGYPSAEQRLHLETSPSPTITPNSRGQALRVLAKLPHVAEKRSRMLVPVLLRWAGGEIPSANDEHGEETASHRWTRKDQKAMLGVFAQFTNPKVIYKSSEVYDALLNLCANGDAEIQASALKAIFAWKKAGVIRYQEHLVNLLDEARFREELSVFLQEGNEDDEAAIRLEDHAELMPVLLHLLYGRAVAGGKHGQGSRRKAIFVALSKFGQHTLGLFVNIATGPLHSSKDQNDKATRTAAPQTPLRQQLGMLNMLSDLLETLGAELEPFAKKILHAILACTIAASKRLESSDEVVGDASLLRSIRQAGFQCLVHVFAELRTSHVAREAPDILEQIIRPRLGNLAAENSQSVSGMLRLFSAWASWTWTSTYLTKVLPQLALLLREPTAKDEVRIFILQDIIDPLLLDDMNPEAYRAHVPELVRSIGFILGSGPNKDVLDACVDALAQLASRIVDPNEASATLKVCGELLTRPSKIVSPRTKIGLLRTMLPLMDVADADDSVYDAVAGLFSRLADPDGRTLLAQVFARCCEQDKSLAEVATICTQLNARSGRLDEPDHEQRERGFTGVANSRTFTARQWLPILHICLLSIRDVDDMVNRSSAAQGLAHFIDAVAANQEDFLPPIRQIIMPEIERGLQQSSELVRAEYLRILGLVTEKLSDWQAVSDMKALTVSGDDEASVFANVLHIQQHRRLRALRRLADEAGTLSSSNITKYFLPLLEHFIFDQAAGDAGRTLADQAVATIGAFGKSLSWSAFRATFKRYIGYINSKEDLEKTVLRLLGVMVDSLAAKPREIPAVSETLGLTNKSQAIVRDFLPPLLDYLHHKDESTVDRRMPVAVTVVKLLLVLPEEELSARLPPILTDVSQVLRSRSQEARDQTRKTLATILGLVGPQYLGFMLKELRSALQRGYQLHVLSFTVHSLLVNLAEACQPGDLDYCISELVSIVMDDVFGITGQEKDAEEYKSGMKEVKSSKSFDTMESLARVTSINKLGLLIRPLRALLSEKLDAKSIQKADELLTRLRKGVDQNPGADSRDMLAFCHEIVRQVYSEQSAPSTTRAELDYKVWKYLIQMESAKKSKNKGATTSQMYKLISFALNLVRKVVRRHEDLLTPTNMARFLPMTGDALVHGHEEVKLSAMRLLATIIKVPLPEVDQNAAVYVKEALSIIKATASMTSDGAKAALELITAVLRERRLVSVKETDIAQLLKALKNDIDEPDRQGTIYKFLRAVLGRKIVITEVYELMDEVGKLTVTNADKNVRESARSAYLQFILDYPQGKDRWNKQAAFFVENLRYEHAAGRQSVMELLHQLLVKLPDDVISRLAFTVFVALVPVLTSDADQACRQMADILITKLFERVADEQLSSFLNLMKKWLDNDKKPMIQIAALQCWQLYLRNKQVPKKQCDQLRDKLADFLTDEEVVVGPQLLQAMLNTYEVLVERAPDTAFAGSSALIWDNVQRCLAMPVPGIQRVAAKLIGAYFSHLGSSSVKSKAGLGILPLVGAQGLNVDADGLRQSCQVGLRAVMACTRESSQTLTAHLARNLAFLGRVFEANKLLWRVQDDNDDLDEVESQSDDAEDEAEDRGFTALAHLLKQLSYIIRQDNLSTVARSAALQCQVLLVNQLQEIPNLQSLLRPLYNLTDPSIPRSTTEAHKALTDQAQELLELVQKKVGSEAYVAALGGARKQARAKREERRQKRKIEAISAPERWAKDKRKKHEAQRAKKKALGAEMRGRRRGW